MKLNSKGITLVELIVSFAIVSVAIIYFFQTLTTVNKLYKTAREETNEYVKKTYALKIVDARLNKIDQTIKNCININCSIPRGGFIFNISLENVDNNIYKIYIKDSRNGPAYATLYKYIPQNISTES